MKEIISLLNNVKSGIDFEKEDNLIEEEILTSFDIITVIALLKKEFNINITAKDINPDNFKNASTIYEMVQRLK